MPVKKADGPDGPYLVRAPFRPEDYTVDRNAMKSITNYKASDLSVDMMLEDRREGPFESWHEVARLERDGKSWVRLCHSSGEYCVDVEVTRVKLGEVVAVDPRTAYDIAVSRDGTRKLRVVQQS